jgi:hypothetical protein
MLEDAPQAIKPNPRKLDNEVIVSRSELNKVTGLNPDSNLTRLAAGQGDINLQRAEFQQTLNKVGLGFEHVPNVLDQYANYTYHLRWSLTDDISGSTVKNREEFNNVKKIVIAESGMTTGFNIIDFELENICAPNMKTQTSIHVKFKMTIKEPYGFSLLDKIYSASRTMGVKNHLTNSSFIELWFTGYDEQGNIQTPQLKNSLYKLFRVIITDMDSDTTAEGTTYSLEGVFDNMYATTDHVMISAALNIGPVVTIGDFFKQYETELNNVQDNLEYDSKKRITYKFVVPDWMSNWKFSQSPTTSTRNSEIDVKDKNNLSNPTISISKGMDINTVLYFVISMTKEGQQFVAGENRSPGSPSSPTAGNTGSSLSANGMANIILIHSKAQLIGFDYLTNDYVRKITYTFTAYPTAKALVSPSNAAAAMQENQQKDKKAVLSASGRYNKVYEYIFTGRNLDIIRFDIKLKWFWQSPIPNQLGTNVYSNWTVAPQLNNSGPLVNILNQYKSAKARLAKAQAEKESLTRKLSGVTEVEWEELARNALLQVNQEITRTQEEIASFGQSARRFQVLWGDLSPGSQAIEGATESQSQNIQIGDRNLLADPRVIRDLANMQVWKKMSDDPRLNLYLEDLPSLAVENPIPVSFVSTQEPVSQGATGGGDGAPPEKSSNNSGPGNIPPGRSLVATVLNDVTFNPYLVECDLEIRGDPYWIGLGNVKEDEVIATMQAPKDTKTAAWFLNGETGFVLTFRSGTAPSEKTGLMDFSSESVAFAGIYNVHTVKSYFSNGQFRQNLKASRDSLYIPKVASEQTTKNTG